MYVGLDHLASCDAGAYCLPWSAGKELPMEAFQGWRLQEGRWINGNLGTKRLENGTVITLYGALDDGSAHLYVDRLCPSSSAPERTSLGIDLIRLASEIEAHLSEE